MTRLVKDYIIRKIKTGSDKRRAVIYNEVTKNRMTTSDLRSFLNTHLNAWEEARELLTNVRASNPDYKVNLNFGIPYFTKTDNRLKKFDDKVAEIIDETIVSLELNGNFDDVQAAIAKAINRISKL